MGRHGLSGSPDDGHRVRQVDRRRGAPARSRCARVAVDRKVVPRLAGADRVTDRGRSLAGEDLAFHRGAVRLRVDLNDVDCALVGLERRIEAEDLARLDADNIKKLRLVDLHQEPDLVDAGH